MTQLLASAFRETRRRDFDRDKLNFVHRNEVSRVAYKGIDIIERERPEVQVHAVAILLVAIAQRIGTCPKEALQRAERMVASRHEDYEKTANIWFDALCMYIDHVHDPKTNAGLRHGDR